MKILQLSENLVLYQFPPEPGKEYGFNIYALISNNEIILIDTGYQKQAQKVLAHLRHQKQIIKKIILSHTHVDHSDGLKALPLSDLFISEQTLPSDVKDLIYKEIHYLKDGSEMEFGDFSLKFISAPGHSESSLYILINESIVHVGDNLIATNECLPILPFVYDGPAHLRSLEILKDFAPQNILLGHGGPIQGQELILTEIDNRKQYIQAVWNANGKTSFEDAVLGSNTAFRYPGWHEHNTKQAKANSRD